MGFGELLGGALDVGTHVLELRGYLLLQGELLHVDRVIRVRGDRRVGVLLPGVGFRPADDDLEAVVLDGAGEGLTQTMRVSSDSLQATCAAKNWSNTS